MASRSLNKVMLIGNLTRDPELRYTPSGVAVCTFGMATNRSWKDAEGNVKEAVEFHRIVAWGKLAELCSQLLFKGRKTFIEGRLQTREWTGKDNNKRTTTEIVLNSMLVLDSRRKEESFKAEPAPIVATEPQSRPKAGQPLAEVRTEKEVKQEVKAEDIPF